VSTDKETATATAAPTAARRAKHFVLDTNVLLHNPDSLFKFEENEVVIPFAVLEELDKFKKGNDDVARNARAAIRHLDGLRSKGRIGEGVVWNAEGGMIRVAFPGQTHPALISEEMPDNRIISIAWEMSKTNPLTIFVSKDINLRIKADALGIESQDFKNQKVDAGHLYSGFVTVEVPQQLIDDLYGDKMLPVESVLPYLIERGVDGDDKPVTLYANEFLIMKSPGSSGSALAQRVGDTEHLMPILERRKPVSGLVARNIQQTLALELLMNDDIKLITMLGSAGSGKTLLALAAGMAKVFTEARYDKLLVARPIMPMGKDIGFLPGDKDEKLSAWMQPIFDNLTYLLSSRGAGSPHAESRPAEHRINQMVAQGQLVLEPLTYIRGRSIPHQFILVDEAQNLSPHEVKTIVSRVGEGTKIVLTGDVGQIDHAYLDASSNGLSYAVERLKGNRICGHITLAKSERSELASLAAEKL